MSVLLVALALQAVAPGWEPAGRAPGLGLSSYYDPASVVVIDGNRRQVRIRAVYDRARDNGIASTNALAELDCPSQTGAVLEMEHLDAAGNVVATVTVPPAERRMEHLPAGSSEAFIHARICRSSSR